MEKIATSYSLKTESKLGYEEAIVAVTGALKAEGFGVLTEIDMQATMKQKLGVDFQRYMILGACNPNLAYQALDIDAEVGLLLPCNVIVFEQGEGSIISIVDPQAMLGVVPGGQLNAIADEARQRLLRVSAALEEMQNFDQSTVQAPHVP